MITSPKIYMLVANKQVNSHSCWVTNIWISYSYWCWVWKLKATSSLAEKRLNSFTQRG